MTEAPSVPTVPITGERLATAASGTVTYARYPHSCSRSFRMTFFALLITVASVGTLAAPSPTLAWSSGAFGGDSEQELLALTNETRASAGMASLRWDPSLASIARAEPGHGHP